MKVIVVVPARYSSSRLPGKPLIDICGEPMIYRVYSNLLKSKKFADIIVATDDDRIVDVCKEKNIKYILTDANHQNHISRVWEVSNRVDADYYICVNGDEPLIDYRNVESIIPKKVGDIKYFLGAFRYLTDPAETIDTANIKILTDRTGKCIYMSRTAVPFPKNSIMFKYKKYVGIECFTKKGLDKFQNSGQGFLEKIEDIDHLRFIENDIEIYFKEIESDSISVDTAKDLEKVREILKNRLKLNNDNKKEMIYCER